MFGVLTERDWLLAATARLLILAVKFHAVGLGAHILLGREARMSGPAYETLTGWAPWWVWGSTLIIYGMGTFVPILTVRFISMLVASVWMWIWWAAVAITALDSFLLTPPCTGTCPPLPGLTGVPTYFILACMYLVVAVSMWNEIHARRGDGGR